MSDDVKETPEPKPSEPSGTPPAAGAAGMSPGLKLAIEMGPLVVFFIAQRKFGLIPATGVLMVAMVLSLTASRVIGGKLPVMPVITTVFVLVMGGLTLLFDDETFIKMKPTLVNVLLGSILLGGLAFGKALLRPAMEPALQMDAPGWHTLTLRVGIFFLLLALLNEYVWRTRSEDSWVTFKTFGIMPLTFVFLMAQMPLIQRHTLAEGGSSDEPGA